MWVDEVGAAASTLRASTPFLPVGNMATLDQSAPPIRGTTVARCKIQNQMQFQGITIFGEAGGVIVRPVTRSVISTMQPSFAIEDKIFSRAFFGKVISRQCGPNMDLVWKGSYPPD